MLFSFSCHFSSTGIASFYAFYASLIICEELENQDKETGAGGGGEKGKEFP